jgi:hypothetical protein
MSSSSSRKDIYTPLENLSLAHFLSNIKNLRCEFYTRQEASESIKRVAHYAASVVSYIECQHVNQPSCAVCAFPLGIKCSLDTLVSHVHKGGNIIYNKEHDKYRPRNLFKVVSCMEQCDPMNKKKYKNSFNLICKIEQWVRCIKKSVRVLESLSMDVTCNQCKHVNKFTYSFIFGPVTALFYPVLHAFEHVENDGTFSDDDEQPSSESDNDDDPDDDDSDDDDSDDDSENEDEDDDDKGDKNDIQTKKQKCS